MPSVPKDWKHPPVVEVLLGLQFAPVSGLSNGHLGLYWHQLRSQYPTADDAPPVPLVVEAFGAEPDFAVPGMVLGPAGADSRLRLRSRDGSRLFQVQNGWIVANWMKQDGVGYPGYGGVLEQFLDGHARFNAFLNAESLPPMVPEAWEVTYIDHIPRGTVWQEWSDVPRLLPGLLGNSAAPGSRLQSVNGAWSFGLANHPGRLTIAVQMSRFLSDPPRDVLVVRSTVRGPITSLPLVESLNCGRTAAVDTFMGIVSPEAKAYWAG